LALAVALALTAKSKSQKAEKIGFDSQIQKPKSRKNWLSQPNPKAKKPKKLAYFSLINLILSPYRQFFRLIPMVESDF
jgi:hypothetical protein